MWYLSCKEAFFIAGVELYIQHCTGPSA